MSNVLDNNGKMEKEKAVQWVKYAKIFCSIGAPGWLRRCSP